MMGASGKTAREELEAVLLAAHGRDDRRALAELYARAADLAEGDGDPDQACFFLTQAYIFALETAHPEAAALYGRLKRAGRET